MSSPAGEMKRRLMLNYLLSIVFGHDDAMEELKKITGAPEDQTPKSDIQQVIDSRPPMPRFKALKNKLQAEETVETTEPRGDNAETGRTE